MKNRLVVTATVLVLLPAASAFAQRVEVSVTGGWTLSDGVSGDPILAGDGNLYDRVDSKDSGSWGFGVGVNASDNAEVGFLFGQQLSTLAISGTTTREVGDLTVNSYHGYFAYNVGEADARVRPYFLVGLGATNFGGVSFTRASGAPGETGGETQFSTTWGAGIKVFPAPHVGVRFGVEWTPTYIKTDSEGWWCDPYWGCYVVGDPQYSNQLQFNGGVTFRF